MYKYVGMLSILSGLLSIPAMGAPKRECVRDVSDKLVMTVSPRVVEAVPRRLLVDLALQNKSGTRVRVGRWLIFSECRVRDRSLHVKIEQGRELERLGRDVGYGAPEAYEILEPGESLRIEGLDVTESYEFPSTSKRLWMWFDTVGWVDVDADGPQCVDVRSKEVQFQFASTLPRKPGIPPEGHVVQRAKRGREIVITCAGP